MERNLEIPYIEKDIEGKNYAQRLGMFELGKGVYDKISKGVHHEY